MTCCRCGGYSHFALTTKEGGFTKYNICESCLPEAQTELHKKGIEYRIREIKIEDEKKRRQTWL
jgi:hypothetical protein